MGFEFNVLVNLSGSHYCTWYCIVVFNVPPTTKVMWRRGHSLVSSDRLVKPGIDPPTSGLQGE